jgi:hypothetical protein
LIAALAVFVGAFPVVPPERASAKREEQLADDAPEEPTHIARMLASVLTFACGARALPLGIMDNACPVATEARFAALRKALATPVCASAVPELETCVASVAKPAMAKAAAIVVTSFTETVGRDERKLSDEGHAPSTAMSPAAALAPAPALPPRE